MTRDSKQQEKDKSGKDGRHGGDRRKGGKHQDFKRNGAPSLLNSDAAVPMLKYGLENFDTFNKKMAIACMEKYKNLGRLIVDVRYYYPPNINLLDYNVTLDLYYIEKNRLREAHKRSEAHKRRDKQHDS